MIQQNLPLAPNPQDFSGEAMSYSSLIYSWFDLQLIVVFLARFTVSSECDPTASILEIRVLTTHLYKSKSYWKFVKGDQRHFGILSIILHVQKIMRLFIASPAASTSLG